ncbi:MAG: N-acetylmuramoyl-L-alanine amidase [Clostridia bacterium]
MGKNDKTKRHNSVTVLLIIAASIVAVMLVLGLSYKAMIKGALNIESVLIDPGHGGSDPGAISTVTGERESEMNLKIARILQAAFEDRNVNTQMTREDENALAKTKDGDMQKRREIIYGSKASIFISIHMNSFPDDAEIWGPQVFYQESSVSSMLLAQNIQDELNRVTGGKRKASADHLYVLNGDPMPAVLVECGFLTNEKEAKLLLTDNYAELITKAIVDGCR